MKKLAPYLGGILIVAGLIAGVSFYLRWRHELEANAVLTFKVKGLDSAITAQASAIDDFATETAALRARPARIIEHQVPVPTFVPSKPDTVDLTDTAAVRVALDQHRAREDSLLHQLVDRARSDSAQLDTVVRAFVAEQRLGAKKDTLIGTLTTRVAVADSLARNYRPRWYDHIVAGVGYTARGHQLDGFVGVKLPWP